MSVLTLVCVVAYHALTNKTHYGRQKIPNRCHGNISREHNLCVNRKSSELSQEGAKDTKRVTSKAPKLEP